jgi:hypothetical protein
MRLLLLLLISLPAHAGGADVGGYFRVMGRPDFQGGAGRLGTWNLYGRLMNEGPYGMLELRYDVLEPQPASTQPWTALHARIEGGSIANASASQGSLAEFRLSQVFVKTGNVAIKDVVWQIGTLEYFFGDLGVYDMRPATVFYDTVGVSARYESNHVEVLIGAGDSGFNLHGLDYNAVPTVGGTVRLRVGQHLEVGAGGEALFEGKRIGNTHAPYQTPGIAYEDWIRGEVAERFVADFPGLEDSFPKPRARRSSSYKAIGYIGFGDLGPVRWNNSFASFGKRHPDTYTTEPLGDRTVDIYVHDFTDERFQLTLGNEMQLTLVPDRLDAVWGTLYGHDRDLDNDIVPSDHDRQYASTVLRLQAYATPTVHVLVESSLATEHSTNGNAYREHADSIFANTEGNPNSRGLETGDTDTRNTWQGKGGLVLSPLGTGIYTRPSFRLLYGLQASNVNQAFGNNFVERLDQFEDFAAVEQHWHHLFAAEAEVWF